MVMTTFLRITRLVTNQLTSCDIELPREILLYTSATYMWRLCSIIRDVINTCDNTIHNLSAYVWDWSLGAHKILHPILSLKSGVTAPHYRRSEHRPHALAPTSPPDGTPDQRWCYRLHSRMVRRTDIDVLVITTGWYAGSTLMFSSSQSDGTLVQRW